MDMSLLAREAYRRHCWQYQPVPGKELPLVMHSYFWCQSRCADLIDNRLCDRLPAKFLDAMDEYGNRHPEKFGKMRNKYGFGLM